MHLYFGLNKVIPCIDSRLSACLYKKYNELLLYGYTFYNELCKWPRIARNRKDYFRFIYTGEWARAIPSICTLPHHIFCCFGSTTVKVVIPPSLIADTSPPWSSQTFLTTARPMPFPSDEWDSSA